ncbi:MAG TPA: ATP-binding cassette domain-containing protein [Gammaproteobacteria bacterium]|nr:ATP-binding cassette domain-containing protein [Gammaproteobacteria bacterium]
MSIVLEQISKRFGNQWVVDNVSLEVADKELFVLLGSSGSGKSTILRMIAGLTQPTIGRILLHGLDVTDLPPQQRGVGFVFQNYSIFRHMTVAENIEFGLRIRKVPKEERTRRREQLLELAGLAGLGSRYSHQLSGGQQQRVALARALVYEPNVLLLDEPFGALDVKIRAQLRRILKEIQQRLAVTTILVTHDQEEAFELSDRIGVLERGRLLEVGAAESLYARPRSLFAATFLGAGTVLVGRAENGQARFGSFTLPIPPESPHDEGARVQMLFRPEQVVLGSDAPPPDVPFIGKGAIIEQSFAGPSRRVRVRLPRPSGTRQLAPPLPFGEESLLIDATLPSEAAVNGQEMWVGLRAWTILDQPDPQLLTCDPGEGPTTPLAITRLLAERMQASTTVLAVAEDADTAEALRAKLGERVQAESLPEAALRVRFGKPAEQIAAEQAASLYEMLVMTARARSRASRRPVLEARAMARQLGETLMTVLEHTDVPVLIAKGERTRLERILICTAAGEPGKSDVRVGGRLARRLGATVTLLYVARESKEVSSLTRSHLDRAAATLKAIDVESEVRIRSAATPLAGIMAEATEGDYDLIVIGAHGPRSRIRFRPNDVMLQVLATAQSHVLVVPPDRV